MYVDFHYTTHCSLVRGNPIRRENPASQLFYVSLPLFWSNTPCLMTAQLLDYWLFPQLWKSIQIPFLSAICLCSIYWNLPKYFLFSFSVPTPFMPGSFQAGEITYCSIPQAMDFFFPHCSHSWHDVWSQS